MDDALTALAYLRAWAKDAYDKADDLRIDLLRARCSDSSSDAIRLVLSERTVDAEDVAGRIGHAVELLERDLAEQAKRRPVTEWRFVHVADGGAWVEPGDPP